MVVAGMSLGWADNSLPENQMNVPKLQVDEFTTFVAE
jgi:nitrobenzene nitroreductase